MKFRALSLRLSTESGPFGLTLSFANGLNVVWADNTAGKSTCVQAIIYALGVEGMISPKSSPPLPHALTEFLDYDGRRVRVLESYVLLEVENEKEEIVTIERTIKGKRDARLVTVHYGSCIVDKSTDHKTKDYYARIPGSAQRDAGFHKFIEKFVGWDLPDVPRVDGKLGPLYAECIFPFFIVEQKRGWSGINSQIPTRYRIRDVAKRAFEFLLDLDAQSLGTKRQVLRQKLVEISAGWKQVNATIESIARSVGGVCRGGRAEPPAIWPPPSIPSILVYRSTQDEDSQLVPIGERLREMRETMREFESTSVPTADDSSSRLEQELELLERRVDEIDFFISETLSSIGHAEGRVEASKLQEKALGDDLERYRDIVRLVGMGSNQDLNFDALFCPTCNQHLEDTTLPQGTVGKVMTPAENMAYIQEQLKMLRGVRKEAARSIKEKNEHLSIAQGQGRSIRARIRDVKKTLASRGDAPSTADVRSRILHEENLANVERAKSDYDSCLNELESLASLWRETQERLGKLPSGDLSDSDQAKINLVQRSVRSQIEKYGLSSLRPHDVGISSDTYRPEYMGFDLAFDLSASDMIRLIWAYLNALLGVGRKRKSNHLGVLVLDEPRQHEARKANFGSFLRELSAAKKYQQQVIIFSSMEIGSIRTPIKGHDYNWIQLEDEKLLVPIRTASADQVR